MSRRRAGSEGGTRGGLGIGGIAGSLGSGARMSGRRLRSRKGGDGAGRGRCTGLIAVCESLKRGKGLHRKIGRLGN